jgi:molybdenum cofactor cytidylyltransferase
VKFGSVPTHEAHGAILAHAARGAESVVRKGVILSEADVAALLAAGVREVVVARPEAGDIGENPAAERLAAAVLGPGVLAEAPFTGRVNLFAASPGVLVIDRARVDAANLVDEAITIATLPDRKAVVAGEMIATVKIIPFAVPGAKLEAAAEAAGGAVKVVPYTRRRVAMISTTTPALKPSVIDKTIRVTAERLSPTGAAIVTDRRVEHGLDALVAALRDTLAEKPDLVVVFGASAVTDRRDVVPAAIEALGGVVEHVGMPVDPGNLLLLGRVGDTPIVGAPGCARSPRENGFDWVLARLLAGLPVGRADIQAMGVGGLLMEIVTRPQPRAEPKHVAAPVAAIVLAAGRSTRMGAVNKLTLPVDGKPMARHAVEAALGAAAAPVIVVTGHEEGAVRAGLSGLDVTFVANPDFADGLSTSLKVGLAAVPPEASGALVFLGDMPRVTAATARRLIEVHAAEPGAAAVAPVAGGRRGNPVLVARALFPAVANITGDTGARALLDAAGDAVVEVPVTEEGVLIDIDTPEALARLAASRPLV